MPSMLPVKGTPPKLKERIQFTLEGKKQSHAAKLNKFIAEGLKGKARLGSTARLHEIAVKARE